MIDSLSKEQLQLLYRLKTELSDTYKHSIEVANYSVLLGKYIKLTEEEIDKLQIAGLFHDIGKLLISKDIINKPGDLTEEEFTEIKKHPIYSVKMLKNTGFDDNIIMNIILTHHERIDGTGYPNHLLKQNILKLTKILSIADSYSAITSDRIYDPKKNVSYAFSELISNSGSQFDSYLVYKFISLLSNNKEKQKCYELEAEM